MKWKDKLIIENGNRTLMKLGVYDYTCSLPDHLIRVRKNGMIDGDRIIYSQYRGHFRLRIYLTIQRGSKFFIKTVREYDASEGHRVVEDYYALN